MVGSHFIVANLHGRNICTQAYSSNFTCGTEQKMWWVCKRRHEWDASIYHRASRNEGCPVCHRIKEGRTLQECYPEVAAEWHPSKNRKLFPMWDTKNIRIAKDRVQKNRRLEPRDVAACSREFVWWQCLVSSSHVWFESVRNRTTKHLGCPFCSGFRIADDNNLAFKYPVVARLWHPTRNLPLTPDKVTSGSAKVVWWRCFRSARHVWQDAILKVVIRHRAGRSGCPICTGH